MKRAVIIAGGDISDYGYIKGFIRDDDIIICADSGYNHAVKMGLEAEIIVGDFDSIEEGCYKEKMLRFPEKKDKTDTEIAVEYARKAGYENFLILGATGYRMDHTLSNIMLLRNFLSEGGYAEIIDEYSKIMITDSKMELNERKGSIVSLIPLTDCFGVVTENLEYPLRNEALYVGRCRGVSNVMLENKAGVSVDEGIMLITVSR